MRMTSYYVESICDDFYRWFWELFNPPSYTPENYTTYEKNQPAILGSKKADVMESKIHIFLIDN